jgi:hypothetical protein
MNDFAYQPADVDIIPVAPIPTRCARRFVAVSPFSKPPLLVWKCSLYGSNALPLNTLPNNILWVFLGQAGAIPIFINPPGSWTGFLDIYSGEGADFPLAIDEFSLSSPLALGTLTLLCVTDM